MSNACIAIGYCVSRLASVSPTLELAYTYTATRKIVLHTSVPPTLYTASRVGIRHANYCSN